MSNNPPMDLAGQSVEYGAVEGENRVMLKAPALKKGDLIGVFAPSSFVEKRKVMAARKFLENKGFKVFVHPQTEARFNQSAGTNAQKRDALHDLLKNKEIKA